MKMKTDMWQYSVKGGHEGCFTVLSVVIACPVGRQLEDGDFMSEIKLLLRIASSNGSPRFSFGSISLCVRPSLTANTGELPDGGLRNAGRKALRGTDLASYRPIGARDSLLPEDDLAR
jgi:hypothetical protein